MNSALFQLQHGKIFLQNMSTSGMTYELALALKNAGFPQTPIRVFPTQEGHSAVFSDGEYYDPEIVGRVYIPTLEELIEMCKTFSSLERLTNINRSWRATSLNGEEAYGVIPTEAAAHLWLALNPSK